MSTLAAAPPPSVQYVSPPPVTLLLIAFLLVFFFLGIFFVIFCKCCLLTLWQNRRGQAGTPVGPVGNVDFPGIDPSIIESFPTFMYSTVKDYRKEEYGLECAICLVEFEDDSILRLLTACNHVFHQECIDLWLESHKTCPVCRRALDTPANKSAAISPVVSPGHHAMHRDNNDQEFNNDLASGDMHISITIKDDDNEGETSGPAGQCETDNSSITNNNNQPQGRNSRRESVVTFNTNDNNGGNHNDDMDEKFSRSHSTGHSIIKIREDEDRFTLRLPEDVRAKIIRGHNATKSCTTFGDHKSNKTAPESVGFSSQV